MVLGPADLHPAKSNPPLVSQLLIEILSRTHHYSWKQILAPSKWLFDMCDLLIPSVPLIFGKSNADLNLSENSL